MAVFLLLLAAVGLALGRVRRLEGLERLLDRLRHKPSKPDGPSARPNNQIWRATPPA